MSRTRVVVLGTDIVGAACGRELALADGDFDVVSDKGPGPELELAKLPRRLWPVLANIGILVAFTVVANAVVAIAVVVLRRPRPGLARTFRAPPPRNTDRRRRSHQSRDRSDSFRAAAGAAGQGRWW